MVSGKPRKRRKSTPVSQLLGVLSVSRNASQALVYFVERLCPVKEVPVREYQGARCLEAC